MYLGLQSTELRQEAGRVGWGCARTCLLPSLDLSAFDVSPSSCWCFGSAQPWAVCRAASGDGQGREMGCSHRYVTGRCEKQGFGTNKVMGLSAWF